MITVVDATAIYQQIKLHQEPSTQIIQADLVYLSKTDISTTTHIDDAHNIIKRLNPVASITDIMNAQILRKAIESYPSKNKCFISASDSHSHEHHHSEAIITDDHLATFKNWSIQSTTPLDRIAFTNWLSSLYSFYPLSILRLKGFVRFKGMNQNLLIQAVGPIFTEIKAVEAQLEDNVAVSLVFIFKDINILIQRDDFKIQTYLRKF